MKEYQSFAGAAQNTGSYENNAEDNTLQQEPATGNNTNGSTKNSEGMVYLDIIPRFAL